MIHFNNEEYQILASDLIGDIFYTSTSYRGKISTLRQYAEIIVRKILDIAPEKEITLGDEEIRTSPTVAEKYLNSLAGNFTRQMVIFENSAHYPQFEENAKFYNWRCNTFIK